MGKYIKKYWFISLLVLLFGAISVYYIYDTNKDVIKGKTSNGEDVVYSIDNDNYTVSNYYDDLYDYGGLSSVRMLFERSVISQSFETTDEMKEQAKTEAEEIRSSFEYQSGANYKTELADILRSMGYKDETDLENYVIDSLKQEKLLNDYGDAHFDELKIRDISYILVMFEDPNNPTSEPTEDEQARMKAVDDAFAKGDDFATVAQNFSEDQSSAPTGGDLGVLDAETTGLDQDFLNAALALKEGEISDWVYSRNFGYFKLKNNASTPETLKAWLEANGSDETNIYYNLANSYDTNFLTRALFAKADEIGYDFLGNDELKDALLGAYGLDTE